MRPVFQTAVIMVDAASEEDAVRLALRRAACLKEEEWVGSFDAHKYCFDVQHVLDATELSQETEANEMPLGAAELAQNLREMHVTEYLVLRADIGRAR